MSYLHIIILAILQGITEFLPVSSSAHLVLLPIVMNWQDQGLLMDVSVHIGTLLAVMLYFRAEVARIIRGGFSTIGLVKKTPEDKDGKLFRYVFLASIPVLVGGAALALLGYEEIFRDPMIIGLASIGFGVFLFVADKWGGSAKTMAHLSYRPAIMIGLFQVLSLIPGTSRSGITMTAGRFLGFNRVDAARFSMVLSIPVILAAGTWSTYELIKTGSNAEILSALVAGFLSFLTALVAIHFLLRWLVNSSMTIFVIYRIILGILLLVYLG